MSNSLFTKIENEVQNLSELAKQELLKRLERARRFERFNELLEDSELTEEQCFKLADELKRRVAKRHGL